MIAAITASGRPEPLAARHPETATGACRSLWNDWLAGLRPIRQNRTLRVVFVVVTIASIGEGVMGTAFWVFIGKILRGGTPEAGVLVSAQADGVLLGSAVIGSWSKSQPPGRLLGWDAVGLGAIDPLTCTYPVFWPALRPGLVTMAVVGIPVTAFATGFTTTIQTETEDAHRARVFGALGTTMALLMIVGATIAGTATGAVGPVTVLGIQSESYILAGALTLGALAPRVATRLEPAEVDPA